MRDWQAELLHALGDDALDEQQLFGFVQHAARAMGFEQCAYGIRVPLPVTRPRLHMLSSYPQAWQQRYQEAGYLAADPTVRHGMSSSAPLVWSDKVFAQAPQLWDEAQGHGLQVGMAQSSRDWHGVAGMLTLARGHEPLRRAELERLGPAFAWLVQTAHVAFSRRLVPQLAGGPTSALTPREAEVLRWTADGKTAGEISDILNLSEHTVAFHLGNAVRKLDSANKTAAAVKAALLGLL
jgi:DNA-binding CsgD family transcriptional regulator